MTRATRWAATGSALAGLLAVAGLLSGCSAATAGRTAGTGSTGTGSTGTATTGATANAAGGTHSTTMAAGAAASQGVGTGCTNLIATSAVKAAVTAAYRAGDPAMTHMVPTPGDFYYGACAGTRYAATSFGLPPGDTTLADQVAAQDDGAMRKYFAQSGTGAWRYLGRNSVDSSPGCASVGLVPAALRSLWHGCPTRPLQAPVLGTAWAPHVLGYGQVEPLTVDNDGDPTGTITGITWASWGGARAVGTGTSTYVAPNQSVSQGTQQTATIVAFTLGTCHGQPAYLDVEWYFPQHGGTFSTDPHVYRNTCTGQ